MKQVTKTRPKKVTVECLVCNDDVYVGQNPKVGSYVTCNGCDAEFQIVDLEPVLIDWPEFDDYVDDEEGYYNDIDEDNDF